MYVSNFTFLRMHLMFNAGKSDIAHTGWYDGNSMVNMVTCRVC